MGGKGGSNMDPEVQKGMLANQTGLEQIAQEQEKNSQQLYNLTEPGLVSSENFYQTLQSGDPGAIMRAIAPTAQASNEAAAGAKANIMANSPAGGEKNLALESVDINRGAQIASTASGASMGANNALAQLAGQGVGESISASSGATGAYSAGSQTLSSLGSLNIQDQQLNMQKKGQTLGAVGGLMGDATSVAGMCPARGSRILMADGTEKPIEDIRIGDRKRCRNGIIDTITSIQSTPMEAIRVCTSDGRELHNSMSHTFDVANGNGFIVAFESYGSGILTGDDGRTIITVVDISPCGQREVFSIKSTHYPSYRADGVWSLGVGDKLSDDYLDTPAVRRKMNAMSPRARIARRNAR
jgi:hypothetical protein